MTKTTLNQYDMPFFAEFPGIASRNIPLQTATPQRFGRGGRLVASSAEHNAKHDEAAGCQRQNRIVLPSTGELHERSTRFNRLRSMNVRNRFEAGWKRVVHRFAVSVPRLTVESVRVASKLGEKEQ